MVWSPTRVLPGWWSDASDSSTLTAMVASRMSVASEGLGMPDLRVMKASTRLLRAYTFHFVSIRVVDIEGPHSFEHWMNAGTNLQPRCLESRLQRVVRLRLDPKRHVMQHTLRLLARKLRRPVRVRDEHDHLRHAASAVGRLQEF